MATLMAVNLAMVLLALLVAGCVPVKEAAVTEADVDAYVASLKETAAPWDKRRVGLRPFTTPRIKVLVERSLWDSPRALSDIRKAVDEINLAMPVDRQLTVEACTEATCRVSGHGRLASVHEGGIAIATDDTCRNEALGCADNDRRNRAEVALSSRLAKVDAPTRHGTIVHELVHALGVDGHSAAARFPRSIMAVHAKRKQGRVRYGSANRLAPIDIAVLQRMYPAKGVQSAHLNQ